MTYTTQQQIRAAFWEMVDEYNAAPEVPRFHLTRKRLKSSGDYNTDTRAAWVDYVDALRKSGQISEALAERVTL